MATERDEDQTEQRIAAILSIALLGIPSVGWLLFLAPAYAANHEYGLFLTTLLSISGVVLFGAIAAMTITAVIRIRRFVHERRAAKLVEYGIVEPPRRME